MRTGWRIILTIVVLAILLGSICFGVGLLTGGNPDRVLQDLNEDYHLIAYRDLVSQYTGQLAQILHIPG